MAQSSLLPPGKIPVLHTVETGEVSGQGWDVAPQGSHPCCNATWILKANHRSAKFKVDQAPTSPFPFLPEQDLQKSPDASALQSQTSARVRKVQHRNTPQQNQQPLLSSDASHHQGHQHG